MKSLKILLLTLIFSFVSSCGFLSDDPVKDQDIFVSEELSATCDLNPDRFGDILDTNIEAQIECLESNFLQFSRYVRSADRGTISEGELSDFVRRFFKENTDTLIQGLKLIFELNMLLLKDEADSISRDNITPLFRLLVTVNKDAIVITKILREMEKEKDRSVIFEKRAQLSAALLRFSKTSLEIISKPDTLAKRLNLKKFLLELNDRLDLGTTVIDEKLADAILFIKKLFFGGAKEILTSSEIEVAIKKIPELILMATDFVLLKEYHFEDNTKYFEFQSKILARFRGIISPLKDHEEIFNIEDLYTLFDSISSEDDEFDIRDYEKVFNSLKRDLIGGDAKVFTYKEFKYLINYINISLDAMNGYEKHKLVTKNIESKTLEEKIILKQDFVLFSERLAKKAISEMIEFGGIPKNVDILNFAKTLTKEIDEFNFNVEFIDAVFGLKIAVAGGKKELLTNEEMYLVLSKVRDMASFYFDIVFIHNSFESGSSKKWNFLSSTIGKIYPLLIENGNVDALNMDDLQVILEELFQEDETHRSRVDNVSLTEDEILVFIQTLKSHILTTTPDAINITEIKSLLKLSQIGMSVLEFAQFYNEKVKLAKEDPGSVALFAREIEVRANSLEAQIQRDLPTLSGINEELDYLEIMKSISVLFKDSNEETLFEIVEKVAPLKTILLGGSRKYLTFNELLSFSGKISSYAKTLFTLTNTDFTDEEDNEKYFKLLLDSFVSIQEKLIVSDQIDYFKASELLIAVDWILNLNVEDDGDRVDYTKFTSSLVNVKGRIIHGLKDPSIDPNDYAQAHKFTAASISKILEWFRGGLEVSYFNERTYKVFDKELQNRSPIKWLNLAKVKEYPGVRKNRILHLRRDFLDSVKKYRHYTFKVEKLDSDNKPVTRFIQYLGTEYRRTKYGHVLTSLIKHVFNIVLEGYTIKQDGIDVVDVPRINMLFIDLKPVLEEFGLWTSNFETFGENVILLSDLFQNTSNGDNALGLDEGVEFVTIVLIASSLTDEVMYEMGDFCDNQGTEKEPSFDTSCYRENLFEIWLNKLSYSEMFPKLTRYYKTQSKEDVIDYIRKTEGFARDVNDESIPMAKRDFTLLIGAMLNIESTFVRFDKNNDNVIDTDELDEAFLIYKASIQKMADLSGWKKSLTKTVFYYMVKNMKIPTTSEVLKYHFQLHFNPMYEEDIKAQRLNIGALLYNLLQYRQ